MERDPVVTPEHISEGLGAFDELEYLGGGTFGDTYRALRGDEECAIKVIHVEGLPDYLLRREVEALARVDHPNVVGFLDSGQFRADGRDFSFLRCEYIDGGDLKRRIDDASRPTTASKMRELLTGLLAGVAEIHDLGILHRDIKPANVALRDGDWGQPVLLDFGLARVMDMSTHTALPSHIGTVRYMAPEQLRASAARRRSDLFSVAVVVYEAITGQHPFIPPGGAATMQTLHETMRVTTPDDPTTLNASCPADVGEVLRRLMAFRPHERLSASAAMRNLESTRDDN
jgi:serine/threonine protein kinase